MLEILLEHLSFFLKSRASFYKLNSVALNKNIILLLWLLLFLLLLYIFMYECQYFKRCGSGGTRKGHDQRTQ